jgi:hypothetical protein
MIKLTVVTVNSKTSGSSVFSMFSISHGVVVLCPMVYFFGNLT